MGILGSREFWGDVPKLPEGFWNTTTDAEGRCTIEGLPAGSYYVDHNDAEYAQFPGQHHGGFQHVAGTDLDEIELKAVPAATVSGTVRYPDGNPVPGARVKILEHYRYTQGGCAAETITDAKGRYTLERLLPSDYDVRVGVAEDLRGLWTVDIRSVGLVKAEGKMDFDFELEKGAVALGRVTLGDTDAPVPGYLVGVTTRKGASPLHLWWAVTDEDGNYRHRIPAGERSVYPGGANPEGYTTRKIDRSEIAVDLDAAEGGTYVNDFALLREAGIRGIVVGASGDPVTGAHVTCFDPPDRMSHPMKTESDDEGRFSFTLPAGTENAQIVAEFEGEVSKLGARFPVADEAKVVIGETGWARLRGSVVDHENKPIAGAKVDWGGLDRLERLSYSATTDKSGRFEAKILPGEGLVTFWGSKEGYGTDGSQAEFKEGETVELEPIRLKRASESLRGRLVDVDGNPVAEAEVSVSANHQPEVPNVATDESGKFVINGLVDGWLDVEIRRSRKLLPLRLRTGNDEKKIIFELRHQRLLLDQPINFVGKLAPDLVGEFWFHTDPLAARSEGKVRLVFFSGIDRSLSFQRNPIRALEKFREEIPDEDLEIILVHGNWPKAEVDEILKNEYPDLKLPLVIEPEVGSMSEKFGIEYWLFVVVDKNGKVVFQNTGKLGEVKKKVRQLMGRDPG